MPGHKRPLLGLHPNHRDVLLALLGHHWVTRGLEAGNLPPDTQDPPPMFEGNNMFWLGRCHAVAPYSCPHTIAIF